MANWFSVNIFGKYKDKKMLDVLQDDAQYVQWYINNKANEYDKKCYEILTGEKLPTEEEQDERISIIATINNLVLETDTDLEDLHNYFHVSSLNEMTNKQLKDCTKILEQKLLKKAVSEE